MMDDTTNGSSGSPGPEPTPEGRARLLTALDLERAGHPVDPGRLGEYVELLDRDGLAAARAAFPSVAAHLAAGCDACNAEVRELREIAALDAPDQGAGYADQTSQSPATFADAGRTDGVPRQGPPVPMTRSSSIRSSAAHAAPSSEDAVAAAARRRRKRVLMTGLTAVAAVAMVIMGASLYALLSLAPRGGPAEIKLIARETLGPATPAAPASTVTGAATVSGPGTVTGAPTPAASTPEAGQTGTAAGAPTAAPATSAPLSAGTPTPVPAPSTAAPSAPATAAPAASPGQSGAAGSPEPGAAGPGSAAPSGNDCPDSHPVKANRESGIYHLRGGVFYDRTRPEVCYATADDAERAGYRRSQR